MYSLRATWYLSVAFILAGVLLFHGRESNAAGVSVANQINATGLVGYSCDPTADMISLNLQNGFVMDLNFTVVLQCNDDLPTSTIQQVFAFEVSPTFVMKGATKPLVNRRCRIKVLGPNPFSTNEQEATEPIVVYYDQNTVCGTVLEDDSDVEPGNYFSVIAFAQNGDWYHNFPFWLFFFYLPVIVIWGFCLVIMWLCIRNKNINRINDLYRKGAGVLRSYTKIGLSDNANEALFPSVSAPPTLIKPAPPPPRRGGKGKATTKHQSFVPVDEDEDQWPSI